MFKQKSIIVVITDEYINSDHPTKAHFQLHLYFNP